MTAKIVYDLEQIKEILPQRYPFLLIDRILELEPGVSCKGLKNISGSEPFFQGHFPDYPVMPGVLVVEALAQVGGVAAHSEVKGIPKIRFGGIEKARFKRPVVPGDQLILDVVVEAHRQYLWHFGGTASVAGDVVATTLVKMMIFPPQASK
jgi:3-hydroxyacyl-[acyl-carrier-protein] dehydratase